MLIVSILLLLLGIFLIVLGASVFHKARNTTPPVKYRPEPLVAPLELEPGQSTEFSFVAEGDFEYSGAVIFERTLDINTLFALVRQIEDNKEFEVLVEEDGSPVDDGYCGIGSGQDIIELTLTSFQVHQGRRYQVRITPKTAYPELAVTNPRAEVAVAYWTYKDDYSTFDHYVKQFAVFLTLVGLVLVLLGWWCFLARY